VRHSHGQSTSKRVKRKKRFFFFFLFEIVYFIKFSNRTESTVTSIVTRSAPIVPVVSHSKKSDNPAFNPWDLAQIWIESITKEESTRKQWEQMYGWMADLDAKVFIFINKFKKKRLFN
jgi:hypothetical protein